jgi:uncharacterized protein YjiS (DUF1127 family)
MSVFEAIRPVPLGSVSTYRLVSMIERAVANVSNWRASIATARALNGLSNEQLDDIGLSRGEISEISSTMAARRF